MSGKLNRREFVKRAAFLGVSAAGASPLLAACAPHVSPTVAAVQTQAASVPTAASSGQPAGQILACNGQPLGSETLKATIEVWSWAAEALSVVVPDFNKLYPQVKVNISNMSDTQEKAAVAIAAGTGAPDVFSMQGGDSQRYINVGGLLDLTEIIGPCKKDFPAYKIEEATANDGKIYAIPWDTGAMGLYYRKDLWEEKGFKVPTLWSEYIEQGIEFAKDNHFMVEMPKSGSSYYFDVLLQEAGGSYFKRDGTVTVDDDLGYQVMTLIKQMYDAGITADIAQWSPGWYSGWKEGTLITNWGAAWMSHVFPDNIKEGEPTFGQWRIAPLPAFKEGGAVSSNSGGSQLVIPSQTKNRDAALAFAVFAMASLEGQVLGTLAGNIAAYLPALRDPRVVNATNPIYGEQKYFALFADLAEKVPTNFLRAAPYGESSAAVGEVMAKLLAGELDVDGAMKEIGTKVREIVAKYQ